jgi:hypothetical protein
MDAEIDVNDKDNPFSIYTDSTIDSCESFGSSQYQDTTIYSSPLQLRDGDGVMMRTKALDIMMQVSRRQRFPLLKLPCQIRYMIL